MTESDKSNFENEGELLLMAEKYAKLTSGECRPQTAMLVYEITGNTRVIDRYFPITGMLEEHELTGFDDLIKEIYQNPNFHLELMGEQKVIQTLDIPAGVRHLVAGHLAEIFYFRRDILEYLLSRQLNFHIYSSALAYKHDGGIMGGQYHPSRRAIQIVMSRLFEGFCDRKPGVAPFLHELGHMFNFFDLTPAEWSANPGLMPGLVGKSKELFLAGKQLEMDRYLARHLGSNNLPRPIGSPYVFQNNTEFCAGYLESFFRNPNFFARQNEVLYAGFTELFNYDPRQAWEVDFMGYVERNNEYYLSGQIPPKHGLTIPTSQ